MIARSLAVAIASSTMLFAGCGTTKLGFLPPEKRDQTAYSCSTDPDCYVQVHPDRDQWLPETIYVDRGKKLALWINNVAEFEDPPIMMKPGTAQILDCSEKNKLIVKCKVSESADPKIKYGYTIRVKGREEYDPFVWPR